MTGEVIDFRTAGAAHRKGLAADDDAMALKEAVDFAVWLHDIVVEGLRSGQLSNHEHGPGAALAELFYALQKRGTDYIELAEEHFQAVYGTDPYTFAARLTGQDPTKAR